MTLKTSFTGNYLRIYFWQGASLVLNLLSMFIVMPRLAGTPAVFGIYSICVAASIFLAYADLGFISAGQKYAGERYARQDRSGEIRFIGFVCWVLSVMVCVYMAGCFVLAFRPQLLIAGLGDPAQHAQARIASHLLCILGLFAPMNVLQRFHQLVFSIRLEEYVFQRMHMLAGVARIASVFVFFRPGVYDVVGFFLFTQVATLTVNLIALLVERRRYDYDLGMVLRSFRFDAEVFARTRALAVSTLFVTLAWILYFELDLFVIGRINGAVAAAYYAAGMSLLSYLRMLFATLYGPFFNRFNHFMGMGDDAQLRELVVNVPVITLPAVVFPVVSALLFMPQLMVSWLGPGYADSVALARFLVAGYLWAFVTHPGAHLVAAQERIRILYGLNAVMVVVFWAGIAVAYGTLGVLAFAVFKAVIFTLLGMYYLRYIARYVGRSTGSLAVEMFAPAIPSVGMLAVLARWVAPRLPSAHDKWSLLAVIAAGAVCSLCATAVYYAVSTRFRSYINGPLRATVAGA